MSSIRVRDPQERARRIVDAVVRVLVADSAVFQALLAGWSRSGRMLEHDPTKELTNCLKEAAASAHLQSELNLRRYGEVMAAGLVGAIHQWSAGLLSDRAFRMRARAVIDVVFAAARSGANI